MSLLSVEKTAAFAVPRSIETAQRAVHQAVNALGWSFTTLLQSADRVQILVKVPPDMVSAGAAKIGVELIRQEGESTLVNLNGSIFGRGPLQARHLVRYHEDFEGSIAEIVQSQANVVEWPPPAELPHGSEKVCPRCSDPASSRP